MSEPVGLDGPTEAVRCPECGARAQGSGDEEGGTVLWLCASDCGWEWEPPAFDAADDILDEDDSDPACPECGWRNPSPRHACIFGPSPGSPGTER
jgi:DNA-directed RNA polymerase subunit RPC12/RpoP